MDSPDYDPVSVTGQMAVRRDADLHDDRDRQCTFGSLPAPTIKIAASTEAFLRMADDTDLDAGPVLDGSVSVPEMGQPHLRGHPAPRVRRAHSGARSRAWARASSCPGPSASSAEQEVEHHGHRSLPPELQPLHPPGPGGQRHRRPHAGGREYRRADRKAKGAPIVTLHDVPAGHKIAARFIAKGEAVRKYDTVIGYASEDLPPGSWMHSHNILFDEVEKDYAFSRSYKPTDYMPEAERATFRGILRADGRVATRNYVGVFTLGNAGATAARKIAAHFTPDRLDAFPMVDGVAPFAHEGGHGMERSGEAMALLRRTIGGTIRNPNTAAALIIASGEESNDLEGFLREQGLERGPALRTLVLAESGGLRRGVEAGIALVKEMLPAANAVTRQPVPVSHLTIGMQCGGSDGFSGLSANPALGAAMDILIRQGGTAILSETPEIFGVEQTLTARARTPEVGQKLVDRMNWWLSHTEGRDCQINGRVSPGNNAGGLPTSWRSRSAARRRVAAPG
jgi:altronate dehydratase